jgi:hypothetical protein
VVKNRYHCYQTLLFVSRRWVSATEFIDVHNGITLALWINKQKRPLRTLWMTITKTGGVKKQPLGPCKIVGVLHGLLLIALSAGLLFKVHAFTQFSKSRFYSSE